MVKRRLKPFVSRFEPYDGRASVRTTLAALVATLLSVKG
jgi:hypothetical protein